MRLNHLNQQTNANNISLFMRCNFSNLQLSPMQRSMLVIMLSEGHLACPQRHSCDRWRRFDDSAITVCSFVGSIHDGFIIFLNQAFFKRPCHIERSSTTLNFVWIINHSKILFVLKEHNSIEVKTWYAVVARRFLWSVDTRNITFSSISNVLEQLGSNVVQVSSYSFTSANLFAQTHVFCFALHVLCV